MRTLKKKIAVTNDKKQKENKSKNEEKKERAVE